MMDPFTGDARMLDALTFEDARAEVAKHPGKVLVRGTEEEVQTMSSRIASGHRVAKNRKMRRKAQAHARRRNRG